MNCYSLTIGSRNTPKAKAKFSDRDDRTIHGDEDSRPAG
jgi:hypothetical protein